MTEISIIKDGITINNYKSVGDNSLTDDFIPMIEKRPSSMDSEALKVEFQDYSYPKFGVEIERFQSHDNCHFTAECEVSPLIGFSLLTKGQFSAKTSLYKNQEFNWQTGSANLLFRNGMGEMDMFFQKEETVELVNFTIPQEAIQDLITKDPEIFERLDCYTQHIGNGTLFPDNHLVSNSVIKAARDIYNCRMMGRNAPSYLEAKMSECLSGLLAPHAGLQENEHYSLCVRDKIHDARNIILANYQNMPSLNELAKMVGTNECTLKKAFKQEFGTTVFQYLFDFRMNLAVHYLLDTSLPIADIGVKLGYDYQSHFCTAFKRKHGISPMEFRLRRGVIART